MKDFEFKSIKNKNKAINKLKRLKAKIAIDGAEGLKHRVDFLVTTFTHQLKDELNSHLLFDEHNIGERDYDTCFEMFDGDLVIHKLITLSKKEYWLKANIKKGLCDSSYKHFLAVYERIELASQEITTDTPDAQFAMNL